MTASDYITQYGGAWPEATAVAVLSPISQRMSEAKSSPDFERVLATCRGCERFSEAGWTCRSGCCGGSSVRLLWAQARGCPIGQW